MIPLSRQKKRGKYNVRSTRCGPASPFVIAYGIGKYLVKRLNMNGTERIEKTKLARMN